MTRRGTIFIIIFAAIASLAVAAFLYYQNILSKPKKLAPVEIGSYQGQNLSSINDIKDNAIKGTQYINKNSYHLKITGLTNGEKDLTYDDILNHQSYQKVVTLNCVEGWSATILWEGVLVRDLFDKTKIPPGSNTIIFKAADGYSTSFPLSYIYDKDIIMASKMNGVVIPPEKGFPFQLVAEDKWGYKWIKWITEIDISNDSNYQGTWESAGYSNSGDLNQSFLKN
jgi:DMSO/TMAO reductase YedYZ molybdopterin-dependent catalytic subunit